MRNLLKALTLGTVLMGSVAASTGINHAGATALAAPARCHTGELYIAPLAGSSRGGMGHVGLEFQVRSLAQQPCRLYGYPGAQLVSGTGHYQRTALQWGNGYLFGGAAKQVVTLATGASAYFGLEWVHFPTPGQACPTAGFLLVTPPDERTPIAVPVSLDTVCGGRLTATTILGKPL